MKINFKKLNLNILTILTLLITDVILIFALIFLFGDLPQKASEVKNLRSLKLTKNVDVDRLDAEVKGSESDFQKLASYYPDDEGFLKFVSALDDLKRQGYLQAFLFKGDEPVRDKLGYPGIPIELEFVGSKDTIGGGLQKLNSLPYLIRPVTLEINRQSAEEGGGYSCMYGGFLYINEGFGTN